MVMAMMKAFVMKGIGKVGFIEKSIPDDPGSTGAIVKTTYTEVRRTYSSTNIQWME